MSLDTYYTIWHYIVLVIALVLFIILTLFSLKEKKAMIRLFLISTAFIAVGMLSLFSLSAVDKYTKRVSVTHIKNRRMLNHESIVFTGIVKNVGNYPIKHVTFELKLVNRGHETGKVKGPNSFYKNRGLLDFLGIKEKDPKENRAQQTLQTYTIATMLMPGKKEFFTVEAPYPPYFKHTAFFHRVFAH